MKKTIKINIVITAILISAFIFRLYFSLDNSKAEYFINNYAGQIANIKGEIIDRPTIKDINQTYTLKAETINDKKENELQIKVTTSKYSPYFYGDILSLKGKLNAPRNFRSDSDREFDYINYLAKDRVYLEMKNPQIEKVKENNWGIYSTLYSIKDKFIENLNKALGEPHSALAGGLVVGEKSALGKDLLDDFRKVGLIHIVVLSGYNITIIAESIRRILSFLPRNLGIILGGMGIIAFGILVGGGATVIRSCIMAIIALLATLLRKDYAVSKALFIAGIIMLIQNPLILLYDPSFQLSFLATLGLILLSTPIESRITFITEKMGIRGLIASTLATQIFVSPYILYMMGQLSIIGMIANILVLPIIPLTMLFITITGIFGFISDILSQIAGYISHILLSYELFIVKNFASLPFSAIQIPKFSFTIVLAIYSIYFVVLTKFDSIFSQLMFWKKSST